MPRIVVIVGLRIVFFNDILIGEYYPENEKGIIKI
jgi:hypothetical protein